MSARGHGRGSVYQRSFDGRWFAVLDISRGGTRRVISFSSRDRDEAEAQLDAWLAENMPDRAEPRPSLARTVYMERARAIATHTRQEWSAKVLAAGGLCTYCRRPLMVVVHKDHVMPVSLGGSDGIDNVVPACWDCNMEKSNLTLDEFLERAEETGFFEKPRRAQVAYRGRIIRIPQEAIRKKHRATFADRAAWW